MQNTTIEYITKEITFYGQIFVFIAGVIGCLCNFLTFTARELRKNSCSFYFLCGSIFELFSLSFGLTTRFAADHLHSHFQNENRFFCKFRAYFVTSIPLIGTYFIVLSAVDRFLSSSTNVRCRSFCSLKIARRSSICSMFLGLTSSLHILLMYDLRPRCSTLPGIYAIFDGLFVVFWLGAIPHGLMLVFAALTIRNIRQLKRRTSLQINFRFDKKNEANLSMMFVQVGLSSVLILTRTIYYAYYILAPPLTDEKRRIGAFLMSFTTLLYYINYGKSFYVYTLSSVVFRRIFWQRLTSIFRRLFSSSNRH